MKLNIEEDVNALLYFYSEGNWYPSDLVDTLMAAIKTHGVKKLLENLRSRNRVPLVIDLIDLLEPLDL